MKKNRYWIAAALWLTIVAATSGIFLLTGCGGGGTTTSSTATALTAKGKVTLPAGFKIPLSQLQVRSDSGQTQVNPDGTFSAPVVSTGAHMIQLIDKATSKVVLLGYADAGSSGTPYANGAGTISAKSTADALLFFGVLGPTLPTSQWPAFQASIVGSTYETQVAAVVSTETVAHPTAITDGDVPIANAVAAIQNTFTPPIATPKTGTAVQKIIVSHSDLTGALIEVQPVSTQSTLLVQPNPNGDGIVAVSTSRRRGALFIYKVGVGPDTHHITDIDPPEEVNSDVDIEPTEEIRSVQMGILNGLLGKFAYVPVTNPPIFIQPDPVEKIAVYDVVAIGPGSTDTLSIVENTVAPHNAAARAAYDKEWKKALLHSQLKSLLKDVIQPLLVEFVLTNAEAGQVAEDDTLETTLESVAEEAPGVAQALAAGDLKGAGAAFMTALEENLGDVKTKTIAALARSLVSTKTIKPETFQAGVTTALNSAAACFALVGVVNKGIVVADITQAFHDNTAYNNADSWVADVLQPVVTLTPPKSFVDTNDPLVHLEVKVQNITDLSPYRFQWTCTNTQGKLESLGSTATLGAGIIPDSKAVYVTDFTKFNVGTVDTVTVTMYDQNDLNTPIGSSTATIKGAPAPCTTTPPPPAAFGSGQAVIKLSEPQTRPGDTLTVTVAWPKDGARTELMEVTLFSAVGDFTAEANRHESAKLISVDGVAAKSDIKDIYFTFNANNQYNSFTYPTPDTTAAQTHTLVFQMLEPTDSSAEANPMPYCSVKASNGGVTYPYVEVANYGSNGGIGSSFFYFNENP